MILLNRASLVVKPSTPYLNWVRSRVGVRMSTQGLIRLGGVYLVDFDAVGESLEEIVTRYGEAIFERELEKWTDARDIWPKRRDVTTFRQWFDVELLDHAVDLGTEPIVFDFEAVDEPEDVEDGGGGAGDGLSVPDWWIGDGGGPMHVWWAGRDHEGGGLAGEDVDECTGAENDDGESPSWVDDPAPYDELFPPSPFASMSFPYNLPEPPEKGPTKGWVYQFKIRLVGIEPVIWRRIQVSALYSFWDLHVAITDVMGWLDSHLHLFSVRNPETGILDPIGIFDAADPDGPGCLPDFKYRIAGYFREPGDRAWYTYDYGDRWVHDVVLETIVPRERGKRYPRCLAGAQACPPEDVGGVLGYLSMLEILNDPSHPEFESYVDWLGGSFDPDRFDAKAVRFDSPKMRFEVAYYDE